MKIPEKRLTHYKATVVFRDKDAIIDHFDASPSTNLFPYGSIIQVPEVNGKVHLYPNDVIKEIALDPVYEDTGKMIEVPDSKEVPW